MFLFRVEGSGGQGVKTATRILGDAGFFSGFNTQDFFVRGPERRGSSITGIVKMDKNYILSRGVDKADFLLLMDMNLDTNEIIRNVKDGGILLFNSKERLDMAYLKKHKIKNYHVNATDIALSIINKAIPNTVMLGALVKVFNRISLKNIKRGVETELGDELNKKAVDEGYRNLKR